jgi:Nif-specific regulatory protein
LQPPDAPGYDRTVPADPPDKVRRERDLYLRLLNLGRETDLGRFLGEALKLVVEVSGAECGYLELHDDRFADDEPRWWMAQGLDEEQIAHVRRSISRGIIAEALATGQPVMTSSALLDPRFRERGSVQIGNIQAVLCVPLGDDVPLGVLYLQGRVAAGPFSDDDRATAELVTRTLAPFTDRLLVRERQEPDPTAEWRARMRLDGIIGRSPALAGLLRQVSLVAPLDITVLLTGESGTGKSQLARVIHDNGPRAGGPFVELNCAALPETLLESELFGALPGSHSTAVRRIEGKVAAAARGTLVLDEIGDLTLSSQGKILHLLQTKQYYPLGSSRPEHADIRVIAATNIDLEQAVAERRFRQDLLYRLQVLPVQVPALADRREDVPDLAAHFAAAACARHGLPGLELSRDAIYAAHAAEWPGNVRQLAHAVEAAVIRAAAEGATRVGRVHLFPESGRASNGETTPSTRTFQEATQQFQAGLLRDTLEEHNWNVMEVARRLDMARSHVYNLIRLFGIERKKRGATVRRS